MDSLLDYMKKDEMKELWDNTLIIFTSDNGDALCHGSCNSPLCFVKIHILMEINVFSVHPFGMSQYPCAKFLTMFFLLFFPTRRVCLFLL